MANNKKKKLRIPTPKIVDKQKHNTPYHLKKRNSNITDNWFAKVVVVLMILAFIVGPIVGVLVYLLND